jgi:hypothetical protein
MRTTITTVLTATIMETSATGTIMEGTEIIMEAITAVMDTTRMVATAVVTGMGGITTAATTRADITRTTPLSSADFRFPSLSRSQASRIKGKNLVRPAGSVQNQACIQSLTEIFLVKMHIRSIMFSAKNQIDRKS